MEEEEREAQKERARRKAAEIEERIKTEKAQQTEKEEVPKLPLVRRFRPIIFRDLTFLRRRRRSTLYSKLH
jgi:hypothetical protein